MTTAGEHFRALGEKAPAPAVLMAIFADNYFLGRTPDGEPFAVCAHTAPSVMIRVRSKQGLRQALAADYFRLRHASPGKEALSSVCETIEGMAGAARHVASAAIRIGQAPSGEYVLDLGRPDGLAVVWSAAGWSMTTRPPVLFRRTAVTSELPVPVTGGGLDDMRDLVNVRGSAEWAVYVACRVLSLIPGVTRPVELITGQPGSAKTGTTRITVGWTGGSMLPMPRSTRSWAALASSAHVIGHDNVSYLTAEFSDLMCKGASGDLWADRALYSDADLFVIRFSPVSLVLNGIELGALRGDIVSRSASHHLMRPASYMGDREVAAAWREAHPAALGWLLDQAVAVMRQCGTMVHSGTERLADFARVLGAVDALWRTSGAACWKGGRQAVYEDAADGDPVAIALRGVIRGPWAGTSAELLATLGIALPPEQGRLWTPRKLSSRIERVQQALEALGWHVALEYDPHTHRRRFSIVPPGGQPAASSNGHGPHLNGRATPGGDQIMAYRRPDGSQFWPRAGVLDPVIL